MHPKKVSIHGPNHPRNEKNPPEKIMHGAVKFIGALIVNYVPERDIMHLTVSARFLIRFDFRGGGGRPASA